MRTTTVLENPKIITLRKEDDEDKISISDRRQERVVTWTEDTIDNEHLGRKKSNSTMISMLHISPKKG